MNKINIKIKKWIKSKTAWVAVSLGSISIIVEQYTPEIKDIISTRLGIEYGVAYGILVSIAMLYLRSITTTSISDK